MPGYPLLQGLREGAQTTVNVDEERRERTSRPVESEFLRRLGSHSAQEMYVFVRVERCHAIRRSASRSQNFHFVQHAVRRHEVVRHAHSVRLHRVAKAV